MTQEDKELLLKDLCARLSFGVKIKIGEHSDYKLIGIVITDEHPIKVEVIENGIPYKIEVSPDIIKPYLRPMSSMTEEEKRHISKMMCLRTYDDGVVHDMTYPVYTPYYVMDDCLSYLRSIHIDYSGLIEKNLALEAQEGMYDLKEK